MLRRVTAAARRFFDRFIAGARRREIDRDLEIRRQLAVDARLVVATRRHAVQERELRARLAHLRRSHRPWGRA